MVKEALEQGPEESPSLFCSAVVLLSCVAVGPNADRIARFTGYNRDKVRKIARRIRANKIWEGYSMDIGPWMDKEQGTVAFILDAMVANGEVKRSGDKYRLTGRGKQKARTAAAKSPRGSR
jgi:hypothetical protein